MNKKRRWSFQKKTEVGEKMINETKVTVSNKFSLIRGKNAYKPIGGKRRADPATVKSLIEMWAKEEEQKKAKKDIIITEDPSQLKNPPEWGMLLPVVPAGLDPGTAKRRMAKPDKKPKKTRKSRKNPEDQLQSRVGNASAGGAGFRNFCCNSPFHRDRTRVGNASAGGAGF